MCSQTEFEPRYPSGSKRSNHPLQIDSGCRSFTPFSLFFSYKWWYKGRPERGRNETRRPPVCLGCLCLHLSPGVVETPVVRIQNRETPLSFRTRGWWRADWEVVEGAWTRLPDSFSFTFLYKQWCVLWRKDRGSC